MTPAAVPQKTARMNAQTADTRKWDYASGATSLTRKSKRARTEVIRPGVREDVEEGNNAGEQDDTEVVLELHSWVPVVAVTVPVQEIRHKTEFDRRCREVEETIRNRCTR